MRQIDSLFFTYNQVAEQLGIQSDSARVLCSRYYSKGLLIRIKRNIYVLKERWERLTDEELYGLANIIQVPSYISLTTALSYFNYTTQIQQDYVESVSVMRTQEKTIEGISFTFSKISEKYYQGFRRHNGIFIASPEKALVDALYLSSLGRYSLDYSALEISKFDRHTLNTFFHDYPAKVKKLWKKYDAD